jgi:hypothetical protein
MSAPTTPAGAAAAHAAADSGESDILGMLDGEADQILREWLESNGGTLQEEAVDHLNGELAKRVAGSVFGRECLIWSQQYDCLAWREDERKKMKQVKMAMYKAIVGGINDEERERVKKSMKRACRESITVTNFCELVKHAIYSSQQGET